MPFARWFVGAFVVVPLLVGGAGATIVGLGEGDGPMVLAGIAMLGVGSMIAKPLMDSED